MNAPALYEICVQGTLSDSWALWFEGMAVRRSSNLTFLSGPLDQAALHGVLVKIGNLGLTLLSVRRLSVPAGPPEAKG